MPDSSHSVQNVSSPEQNRTVTGGDLLPPVEEPSAGFILQLFVVPAMIVLVIVAVALMFNWLVYRTAMQPKELIEGLREGPSVARWQRASELADMLRNERFVEFKRDPKAAAQLAQILGREIDAAGTGVGMEKEDVLMRYYLARALGEFETNAGIDVLLKAARTSRDPAEEMVRKGAVEAIAVRAYNLRQLKPPRELSHPELESTLIELASDEEPVIRSTTAYALGRLGTPAAIDQLTVMVDDPHADTRYNAAITLAHRGEPKAVGTLAEMLDLEEPPSVREETNAQDQSLKRAVMFSNALKAVEELAADQPNADFSPVIESLAAVGAADEDALAKARIPSRLAAEGERVLAELKRSK